MPIFQLVRIIMKRGKKICKTLKKVRKQVAKANDIAYSPTVCHHKGDCAGTCPACEAEVRYLEQQLQLRRQLGKAVAVVGVSMGLVAMASCESKKAAPDSGSETVSVVSQTVDNKAADIDSVPDTLSTFDPRRGELPPNIAHDTTLTVSQVVEPRIYEIDGEILVPDPDPIPVSVPVSSFPGGQHALREFLNENIKYPEQAKKDSITGRVVVKFVVEENGSITNPQIVRGIHPLLDAEALHVVNLMPKWKPGKQGVFILPITFKLD